MIKMLVSDVSYEYYFSSYNCGREGKLSPSDFDFYCRRATEEVALRINNDATEEQKDNLRLAICEVADLISSSAAPHNIKSENIDGYSVTYKDHAPLSSSIASILEKHLSGSGLLYRGV